MVHDRIQHLIGVATGILLYTAVWRLGIARSVACIPAAVVFFSGDHLYLEHSVMADFLLTFFAAAGLCCAVFGLSERSAWKWLSLAGAVLAAAVLVRSVGVVLLPVVLVCVVLWWPSDWRRRLLCCVAALTAAGAVFGSYYLAFRLTRGDPLAYRT